MDGNLSPGGFRRNPFPKENRTDTANAVPTMPRRPPRIVPVPRRFARPFRPAESSGPGYGDESHAPLASDAMFPLRRQSFFHFSRRLFVTTDTELNAMAAPASMGLINIPHSG